MIELGAGVHPANHTCDPLCEMSRCCLHIADFGPSIILLVMDLSLGEILFFVIIGGTRKIDVELHQKSDGFLDVEMIYAFNERLLRPWFN